MKDKKEKKSIKFRIQPDWHWVTTIFGATIGISATMSFLSNQLLSGSLVLSFVALTAIILLGILFDIIGVAATSADETPFHSMAAKKVPEARAALKLLRRAERVSSFCNDVVGDICGVISGSASAVIAARAIVGMESWLGQLVQLLMSAVVAGLTVGGKAFGKSIAIKNSTMIIHAAAKLIYGVKSLPRWIMGTVRRS